MRKIPIILFYLCFTLSFSQVTPDCAGYGCNWTFPSYTVRKVTNLNDSGAGSFRAAATVANSLVVFEVAGYVDVQSTINGAQNVYIAGQTAFRYGGQGITLRKSSAWTGSVFSGGSNTILSHLRVRNGYANNSDCCGDSVIFSFKEDVLINYCSFSHGNDEVLDLSGSNDVTVQNTIIAEPLTEFNFAYSKTVQGNGNRITFYRTLISASEGRNPALSPFSGASGDHYYEVVNCIVFNSNRDEEQFRFSDGQSDSPMFINLIGNEAIRGSQSPQTARGANASYLGGLTAYVYDNIDGVYDTGPEDDWQFIGRYESPGTALSTSYKSTTPLSTPIITNGNTILPVSEVRDILPLIGATMGGFRDGVDQRQLDNIAIGSTSRTYPKYNISEDGGFPVISGMGTVESDTDGDGIPDLEESTWGNDTFGYVNSLVGSVTPPSNPTPTGLKRNFFNKKKGFF